MVKGDKEKQFSRFNFSWLFYDFILKISNSEYKLFPRSVEFLDHP